MDSSSFGEIMVESKSSSSEDESERLLYSPEDRDRTVKRKYRYCHYIAAILGLSNVILIACMFIFLPHPKKTIDKPWLPPECESSMLIF